MNEARGVTLPELEGMPNLERRYGRSTSESLGAYDKARIECRERQLTASLEREAELREQLAVAQNAALTRENEQSAMGAATVQERFDLRERLRETERALILALDKPAIEHWMAESRAELAKEKANG
jgi:hypothetical protein